MKLHPFEKRVLNELRDICPDAESSSLLIAVSGGIDSMVLLHVFQALNLKFELAHCNFCLRGEESDNDEALVKETALSLDVNLHVKKFEHLKDHPKDISIQKLARDLRYQWFEELIKERDLDFLVLAHHANDNFETALYQFVKGTGLKGLKGIPKVNGKILRPLLHIEKSDIIKYAESQLINYRDDSSNTSTKYKRNLIRLEAIPILQKINPDLIKTFQKHADLYIDAQELLASTTQNFIENHTTKKAGLFKINFRELNNQAGKLNILLLMIEPYGFTLDQVKSIFRDGYYQSGKQLASKTHKLIFNREELIITPIESIREEYLINEIPAIIDTSQGQLTIEHTNSNTLNIKDINTIYLKDSLQLPFLIRTWKEGDLFYPTGMQGKKQKLKDYYINKKYSIPEKQTQLLLTNNNEICWVIGQRADERFIETDPSKTAKKVSWNSSVNMEA